MLECYCDLWVSWKIKGVMKLDGLILMYLCSKKIISSLGMVSVTYDLTLVCYSLYFIPSANQNRLIVEFSKPEIILITSYIN